MFCKQYTCLNMCTAKVFTLKAQEPFFGVRRITEPILTNTIQPKPTDIM